ncbi:MAG TPA: sugar phosphate isomerase/epimerase [Propionibacteriaceae bacterium]|nr:sugar phosphate isomerase/epimerase [Propionibacteriaceae bacterium]
MASVGVQMMMVREKVAADGMLPVLEKIAGLGYTSVEVSQVPMDETNVAALERGRSDLGVEVAALSVALQKGPTATGDALDKDFDKVVDDCRRLGCSYLRIGMMPVPAMVSKQAVEDFARQCEEASQRLLAEGIQLAYHNHHVDFSKYDGETLFDIVRRVSPSLHFEIDVHWVQRGGKNPVDVLRDFAGQVELVHLKDYRIGTLPASAADLLAAGDREGFSRAFAGLVQFAEVGAGTLDFASIIPTAVQSGAQHLLVEQDELYGRDVYDCLADSIAHVRSLGY